jgi:hypothetical protein
MQIIEGVKKQEYFMRKMSRNENIKIMSIKLIKTTMADG